MHTRTHTHTHTHTHASASARTRTLSLTRFLCHTQSCALSSSLTHRDTHMNTHMHTQMHRGTHTNSLTRTHSLFAMTLRLILNSLMIMILRLTLRLLFNTDTSLLQHFSPSPPILPPPTPFFWLTLLKSLEHLPDFKLNRPFWLRSSRTHSFAPSSLFDMRASVGPRTMNSRHVRETIDIAPGCSCVYTPPPASSTLAGPPDRPPHFAFPPASAALSFSDVAPTSSLAAAPETCPAAVLPASPHASAMFSMSTLCLPFSCYFFFFFFVSALASRLPPLICNHYITRHANNWLIDQCNIGAGKVWKSHGKTHWSYSECGPRENKESLKRKWISKSILIATKFQIRWYSFTGASMSEPISVRTRPVCKHNFLCSRTGLWKPPSGRSHAHFAEREQEFGKSLAGDRNPWPRASGQDPRGSWENPTQWLYLCHGGILFNSFPNFTPETRP